MHLLVFFNLTIGFDSHTAVGGMLHRARLLDDILRTFHSGTLVTRSLCGDRGARPRSVLQLLHVIDVLIAELLQLLSHLADLGKAIDLVDSAIYFTLSLVLANALGL